MRDVGLGRRRASAALSSAPQAAKPWARLPQDRCARRGPRWPQRADLVEIGVAAVVRLRSRDALGDLADPWTAARSSTVPPLGRQAASSCQVRPSRSIRAMASDGPQVPAI